MKSDDSTFALGQTAGNLFTQCFVGNAVTKEDHTDAPRMHVSTTVLLNSV